MEQRPISPSSREAQKKNTQRSRLSVGLILTPRFTLGALANFVDVLRLSGDEGDRSRPILCEWEILSENTESVRSSCGITVQPTARLGDPSRFHYIGVVGGLIDEIPNLPPAYRAYLRLAAERRIPLLGICTGAFVLHNIGLMNGYNCCINWFHHDDFLRQFEDWNPVFDRTFIVDRDRLTCTGGASSAHLAASLVERHISTTAARKSLRIMMFEERTSEESAQPSMPLSIKSTDPLARKALFLMQEHQYAPLEIGEIADRLCKR